MTATAALGPRCRAAASCGPTENSGRRPVVPPPVAVTVTIALTSRPPSGRNSFWYASTENRGTFDLEKLAIRSAP